MRNAVALSALLSLSAPVARAVEVPASGDRIDVHATATPLADVLDDLARQTGMKVYYDGTPPRTLVSPSLDRVTPAEATLRLLDGLGVSYAAALDTTGRRVDTLLIVGAGASSTRGGSWAPSPSVGADSSRLGGRRNRTGEGQDPDRPRRNNRRNRRGNRDKDQADEPLEEPREPVRDAPAARGATSPQQPAPPPTPEPDEEEVIEEEVSEEGDEEPSPANAPPAAAPGPAPLFAPGAPGYPGATVGGLGVFPAPPAPPPPPQHEAEEEN